MNWNVRKSVTVARVACEKGFTHVAVLIEYQCNVNAIDVEGDTPAYLACINRHNIFLTLLEAQSRSLGCGMVRWLENVPSPFLSTNRRKTAVSEILQLLRDH